MGLKYILPVLLLAILPLAYGYVLPPSESDEILIDSDEGDVDDIDLWYHDHRDNHDHRDKKKKEFQCPYPYGRYADPKDCAQYYVCKFGVPHVYKCSRNKLYDAKKETCRDRRDVSCKKKESKEDSSSEEDSHEAKERGTLECPYIWGTYAHPVDCSKYYVCNYKRPSVYTCRDNELFDEKESKCRDQRRVKCGKRLDRDQMKTSKKPYVTTTTTRRTTYKTTTTKRSKTTTVKGRQTTTTRRPTTTTVRPDKTTTRRIRTTTSTPTTTKKTFFCPFRFGRFSDSQDCSRYYSCHFFVHKLNECPGNTLYDERKEECREAKKVKCNNRPRGSKDDYDEGKDDKESFQCPYVWGTFTHPVDCSKYIVCVYNVPTVFTCRKTELFEPKYRRCLPSNKVDCKGRINPDDQSSTTPSSRTTSSPKTASPVPTTTNTPTTIKIKTAPPTTIPPTTTAPTTVPTTTTTPIPTTTTTPTTMPTTTTTPTTIPTTTTTPTTIPTTTTTPTTIPTTTATPTTIPTTTTTPTTIPTTTTTPTTIPTTTITPTTIPTTTTTTPIPTTTPTTTTVKPNIPPPTDCDDDDPDCIMEETKDAEKWFKCPERYGHFSHGGSIHLFVHCDNWHPFIKKCAEGTKFHPEYLVCVWDGQGKLRDA